MEDLLWADGFYRGKKGKIKFERDDKGIRAGGVCKVNSKVYK